MYIEGYVKTESGKVRENNEDNFAYKDVYRRADSREGEEHEIKASSDLLCGVFDGMGGEADGEKASETAARLLVQTYRTDFSDWMEYITNAKTKICEYAAEKNISVMGTTAALLYFDKSIVHICNMGDSRIYRFRNNTLEKLSRDHTELQQMLDLNIEGFNPETSAVNRHAITRFIGKGSDPEPHTFTDSSPMENDIYILCSDGLTDMLSDVRIASIISSEQTSRDICISLVNNALAAGGKDNVTVMVLRLIKRNIFKTMIERIMED